MAVWRVILTKPPYSNWDAAGINLLSGFDLEMQVAARVPESRLILRHQLIHPL